MNSKLGFWLRAFYIILSMRITCLGFSCEQPTEISYPPINSYSDWNIDFLLDKAERSFFEEDFEEADKKFSQAIELCQKQSKQEIRLCRGLLGRSIARASLGNEEIANQDLAELREKIRSFSCTESDNDSTHVYYAGGKPILGEDQISVEECIKRTEKTISTIKDVIGLCPISSKWKAGFYTTLYLMENQAIECCKAGGIWKACLQPILDKWMELRDWEKECRRSGHWYLLD